MDERDADAPPTQVPSAPLMPTSPVATSPSERSDGDLLALTFGAVVMSLPLLLVAWPVNKWLASGDADWMYWAIPISVGGAILLFGLLRWRPLRFLRVLVAIAGVLAVPAILVAGAVVPTAEEKLAAADREWLEANPVDDEAPVGDPLESDMAAALRGLGSAYSSDPTVQLGTGAAQMLLGQGVVNTHNNCAGAFDALEEQEGPNVAYDRGGAVAACREFRG